jgi:hypothetical protein
MFVLLALCVSTVSAQAYMTYWHNWADATGETHLTLCNFTSGWITSAFQPGQAPIFINKLLNASTAGGVNIFFTPTLWNPAVKFHANPSVQWGFWFAGRMRFTATDGSTALIGAGDVYFGDDVGSKGHHSEAIGYGPALSAMVPVKGPLGSGPCWPSL